MPLAPGLRLGPYEVVARIGAGGMGEVYRGRDTRLHRDVALKVLPDLFAADPDRFARFLREAQLLASLTHSNIGGIYGLEDAGGTPALVLELVEGPTLAVRIAQGPVPIGEALSIARQIAEALEVAHEQGIIHRDLKPSNIKLRPDGTVKVLDFGLAKALDPEPTSDSSSSSTITSPATRPGVFLGTAAYMSPEQARGQRVDKRVDIWAFGCVLYEMLAGKRAFAGDTVSDTLAAVLCGEPDWNAIDAATPRTIRNLVRRCLAKDRRERLRDIGDAVLEIRDARTAFDGGSPVISPAPPRVGHARLAWSVPAVLLGVLVGAVALAPFLRRAPADTRLYRTAILLPADLTFGPNLSPSSRFALSPDGRYLAYVARAGRHRLLWVRPLDAPAAQPLDGTEDAAYPFWSPDSRFLAFFSDAKLKKIDVSGGPPVTLADASALVPGSWSRDDVIVFTPDSGPLYRVSASGGTPAPVTTLDSKTGDTAHASPFFLPDARHFLYLAVGRTTTGLNEARAVYVGSLDGKAPKLLLEGRSNAMYAQGHLVFLRQNTLMAQPFDVTRLELTGEALPIAEQVQLGRFVGLRGAFSVSETGILAYQPGVSEIRSQLAWVDRAGREVGLLGEPADYGNLWLSPDARHVAVSVLDPERISRDVWVFDVARGVRTRFTFDPAEEENFIWSPDGSRVVFNSRRKGPFDLYQRASSGAGADEVLLEDDVHKVPTSWSPDGRLLLYYRAKAPADNDMWVLPLSGDRKPYPFLQTPFNEGQGRFSPDGRWVAYVSNEGGGAEVYVASFPSATGKSRISNGGGTWPQWRRDGQEIFYLQADNKLVAVAVNGEGARFEVGAVRPLFTTRWKTHGNPYHVSSDGQRVLVNALLEETSPTPITLVVNWPALLKK